MGKNSGDFDLRFTVFQHWTVLRRAEVLSEKERERGNRKLDT